MRVWVMQGVHLYSGGAGLPLVRDQAEDANDERWGKGNFISSRNVKFICHHSFLPSMKYLISKKDKEVK